MALVRNIQNAVCAVCVAALCMLPACRQEGSKKNSSAAQVTKRKRVIEQEAQLVDVPVPIGAQAVSADAQEGLFSSTSMLTYTTQQVPDRLAEFYRQEMERLGWQHGARFNGAEQLLYFEKPGRFCVVSIRPAVKKGHLLVITTGRKELGYS